MLKYRFGRIQRKIKKIVKFIKLKNLKKILLKNNLIFLLKIKLIKAKKINWAYRSLKFRQRETFFVKILKYFY